MRPLYLAICLFCVFLISCREDILLPDLEGSLVGYVYSFDEFANQLDDRSDLLVTAYGMNQYKYYTDKYGRFEFKNLPAGTYELHFEKPGFAALKQFGIQHLGGQPTVLGLSFDGSVNSSAFFIYQLPTTEIVNLSVENDTITGSFIFSGLEPEYFSLQVYFSDIPGFELSDAKFVSNRYVFRDQENFKGPLYGNILPFKPGEMIYFKACLLNRRGAITDFYNRVVVGIDSYFDYVTNTWVYPNEGDASEEYHFIIPE